MDIYDKYKNGRDMAWKALLESGVSRLPVNLKAVADAYNIEIYSYDTAVKNGIISEEAAKGSGFSRFYNGKKQIFVDGSNSKPFVRYEMAIQLGHCIMGHYLTGKPCERKSKGKKSMSATDYEAYIFERDLLMPATVLYGLKVHSAEEIEELCNVPHKFAVKRAKRMEELYKRDKFNSSETERLVFDRFIEFIYKYAN